MKSNYILSNLIDQVIALIILLLLLPLLGILYVLVKLTSRGCFIFKQKRMGKDMKIFTIYKIRTMIEGAEKLQNKYKELNQYNDPIFKIHEDPRYTTVGKFLAKAGLDEIPQLINILKGDMTIVGPRPLPISEGKKVPKRYIKRFKVLPGIIPPWLRVGSESLTTNLWLEEDLKYVKNKSLKYDSVLFLKGMMHLIKVL